MEFLFEIIFEVLLEGIFGLTVENPKVKTWVKTLVFIAFSQVLTVLFLWLTLSAWQEGNNGAVVIGVITALWGAGTLVGAICGHRNDWKRND